MTTADDVSQHILHSFITSSKVGEDMDDLLHSAVVCTDRTHLETSDFQDHLYFSFYSLLIKIHSNTEMV